jgi:hypothetical protein
MLNSSQSSPWGRGNVFVAGDEDHATPRDGKQTMEIKASWESNSSLSISYPQNAHVFLKKPSVAGVAVKYKALP